MKFWQKTFIVILAVFIVFINICLYLIARYYYTLDMKRDADRALGEYHFISKSVYQTLDSMYFREQTIPVPDYMQSFMRSYADYYAKQHVYLELWNAGKPIFSNTPSDADSHATIQSLIQDADDSKIQMINDMNYLFITGNVSDHDGKYTLVYVRDKSELYVAQSQLTRYLIIVSISMEIALALVLLLLLRKLTSPVRALQKAAFEIAGGVYDRRISIAGKDEFHELAVSFNQMAASIQEKISELDQTAQNKQRLVDNLAHELRTPLTAIRGYAEYLQNANAREQDRIKAAKYILSETDRMQSLAFKLLDLALLSNSTIDLHPIVPSLLIDSVNQAAEQKLSEKHIKLDVSCMLHELTGDPVLLQSLLINLIDNAAKASTPGSTIRLSVYGGAVPILEVQDFGCGMEEEQIALVCEPFYRVDKARTRHAGGVGLGLSLCRQIAILHGAELTIQSRPGVGTTVQVIFTTPLQLSENSMISGGL
ncbi:ATP-binding protein [Paenibacillus allorhizosphaerae]|uniref:histidine kinase n=1 Tax=Paenibacillus allorhizosphaerae TaxID=2849866 RepID=A0ABN7TL38_9BACL|nr:HAMP domain-containing sensor histidine kinase [Paenibacillus allorhizosphaerae]CAG7644978.1 Adaptive-response sensory-kinase SasA [Paenibacillus allorhizosphaerae]